MSSRTKDTNRSACSRDDWQPGERRAAVCWTSGFSASASLFTLPCALRPSARPRIRSSQLLALVRAGIKALGEGAQLRRRRSGHGRSVAGRQHLRVKPGQRGNGLLRRRPVPGRDPRRARNPLLEPQQIPQGIEIEGQHRITRDQDPVTGPEKQTCPGLWPGVGMHSQSASPGTPASGSKACAASVMLVFAAIRAARRGMRRISGSISHRPIGSPYSGRYFPAASGSSPGCTYTGRSQLRASSSAEPA